MITTGLDFPFDDSEYAEDTAVLFDSRIDLSEFTPLIFDAILVNPQKLKLSLLLVVISHVIQRFFGQDVFQLDLEVR